MSQHDDINYKRLLYLGRQLFKHCASNQGVTSLQLRKRRYELLTTKGVDVTEQELIDECQLVLNKPSFKHTSKYYKLLQLDDNELAAIEETVDVLTKRNVPEDIIDSIVADFLREPSFTDIYFYTPISSLHQSPEQFITHKFQQQGVDVHENTPTPSTQNIDHIVDLLVKEQALLTYDILNEINNTAQEQYLLRRQFDNFTYLKQRSRYPIVLTSYDALFVFELLIQLFKRLHLHFKTSCAILRHSRFQPVLSLLLQTIKQQIESKEFIFDPEPTLTPAIAQHLQQVQLLSTRLQSMV